MVFQLGENISFFEVRREKFNRVVISEGAQCPGSLAEANSYRKVCSAAEQGLAMDRGIQYGFPEPGDPRGALRPTRSKRGQE